MADLDTLEKRINSDTRKARSDKKIAEAVETYKKIETELNA